ncbi:MAG: CopG family transcriptional regulator [Acidobacteria bacterium]|nr:CopG family transcriptional regulator [Acidobacteriota bacterium]
MPFSFRLDPDTEAKIRKLTTATGRSKSEVVREAVAQYAPDRDAVPAPGESAFDRLKPFVGVVSTGGMDYSKQTHLKYRDLLRRKHRARRPR